MFRQWMHSSPRTANRTGAIYIASGSHRPGVAKLQGEWSVCGRKRNGPRTALQKTIANRIDTAILFRNTQAIENPSGAGLLQNRSRLCEK